MKIPKIKLKPRMKKWIRRIITAGILISVCALGVNYYVIAATKGKILTPEEAVSLDADCILVLGAGVHPDGTPSNMLEDRLGLDAYGVGSDPQTYWGQTKRDLREILARNKDVITCIIKPKPTYLGDAIPVDGDGNLTNDKDSIQAAP